MMLTVNVAKVHANFPGPVNPQFFCCDCFSKQEQHRGSLSGSIIIVGTGGFVVNNVCPLPLAPFLRD